MSQKLLIAYDRNTPGLDGEYDCIYDEFGTLGELVLEWLGYSLASDAGPWRITILDPGLFSKFKKDFLRLSELSPILKSFEDVWAITYIKDASNIVVVEHPSEAVMQELELIMESDLWEQKKKK